jgi:hypothetical protein
LNCTFFAYNLVLALLWSLIIHVAPVIAALDVLVSFRDLRSAAAAALPPPVFSGASRDHNRSFIYYDERRGDQLGQQGGRKQVFLAVYEERVN